ncbi:MAG: C-GCAxxG-C-C family protein [Acidobacteriota bacterium]|nr:C-GCAxxG-C-C family protein [Acidobacteriota bacterium]
MDSNKKMDRRQLVTLLGGLAGAGAAAHLFASTEKSAAAAGASGMQQTPWPYKPLDPDAVAQRAYESYLKGHCMYGSFEAIVGTVADQLGGPYKDFPYAMFKYGAGGVNGWATLCGSLNGSVAAIQLLSPNPNPLIDNLMAWYEVAPLPNFYPKGAKFPEVRSMAGTPLCHESIAHWCKKAEKKSYSPERVERCGTLTASVARQAVVLLNEQAAGKTMEVFGLSKQAQGCSGCHEKGGMVENIRAKMECGECHTAEVKSGHGK